MKNTKARPSAFLAETIKTQAGKLNISSFIWLVSLVAVLLQGCHFFRSPGKDHCERIISRQKMTALLEDVYLLEAFLLEEQPHRPGLRDSALYYYAGLFMRHDISRETFEEALACYLLHQTEIEAIHEELQKRFGLLQSQLKTETNPEASDQKED